MKEMIGGSIYGTFYDWIKSKIVEIIVQGLSGHESFNGSNY